MSRADNPRRTITLVVPEDIEPTRLDSFLASQESLGLSRTKVQRLIEDAEVRVNGKIEPGKFKVTGGEALSVLLPEPPHTDVAPEDISLDIVFEDEYLAVINKPAGMVTHPAAGNYSGTLVNALVHHFKSLPSAYGTERPGIVHRLDKNTSGLLLVARQEETLVRLQRALAQREISRTYLALVCGHMPREQGEIDLPVGRSTRDRTKMAVVSSGRTAVTAYQLRERFRSYDLLDIQLRTGRTHQIRVHFSHLGHAVLGDAEYGGREKWLRGVFAPDRPLARKLLEILGRQALHARRLELIHPHTGQALAFESAPPADFQLVLALLDSRGR